MPYASSRREDANSPMNIKTSHIAIVGLLAIALMNGENIRNSTAKTASTKTRKESFKERIKEEKERSANARELSKVAIDRYKAKCIIVIDESKKKEAYFVPGSLVLDTALGRPVRDGAAICNKLGDTAIVANGAIEDIASVDEEDWEAFTALMERRGYTAKSKATEPKEIQK